MNDIIAHILATVTLGVCIAIYLGGKVSRRGMQSLLIFMVLMLMIMVIQLIAIAAVRVVSGEIAYK